MFVQAFVQAFVQTFIEMMVVDYIGNCKAVRRGVYKDDYKTS
jgi:hypothetical protein